MPGGFSIWHILIVLAVGVVLFGGGGRISNSLGDLGKGIRNFRKGMAGEDDKPKDDKAKTDEPKAIENGGDKAKS